MTLARNARRAIPALLIAAALGLGACGEDDVEREANDAADAAEDVGKDAAKEAEKGAEKLEKEVQD